MVLADGTGVPMIRWADSRRFAHWEAVVDSDEPVLRWSFALRSADGRAVYRVPAGIANAVERLDRWEIDLTAALPHDVPDWARGALIYQIFPERFANGDPSLDPPDAEPWGSPPHWLKFQGGDLPGLRDRADHLAGLGVDAVYLNPIFRAPSTHKYDTVDYYEVDPAFGGNAAFAELIETLHQRDIRVILDASFNHCHPRFFAFADIVARGRASQYWDWFVVDEEGPRIVTRPHLVTDGGWGNPEEYERYLERLAEESAIPTEAATDDGPVVETTYEAWYGVPTLPRINLANPETRRYFLDVAAHWLREYEVDGWRMDVTRYVDFDFWTEFRIAARAARPDAYLLAEVMGDAGPWLQGDRFDAAMNYTFRDLCLDYFATGASSTDEFLDGYVRLLAHYSPTVTAVSQNLLGSHDTPRVLTEAEGRAERLVPMFLFQLTAPGAPGIYYGDEVGMAGGNDPGCRGAFPWHDPDSWDHTLLKTVRALGTLRRGHPALRRGGWQLAWHDNDGFAFTRRAGEERLLVMINRGEPRARVVIPAETRRPEVLWGGAAAVTLDDYVVLNGVAGASGAVVKL